MYQSGIVTGTTSDVTVAPAQTAYMWAYKAENIEGRGFYLSDQDGERLQYGTDSELEANLGDEESMMVKLHKVGVDSSTDLSKMQIRYAPVGEGGLPLYDEPPNNGVQPENGVRYQLLQPTFAANEIGGGSAKLVRNRIYNTANADDDKYATAPIYNVLKNNGAFAPITKGEVVEHTFNTNTHGRVMLNTSENQPWTLITRTENIAGENTIIKGVKIWPTEGMPIVDKYNAGYVHQRTT